MVAEIENFYGCYLLVSANKKFKGWTYIGFTVDPNRRIGQHNVGREKGGAWRTSGKGPWDMVLIIHGFPNMVHALQFEWAWQHPSKSLKLKDVCERHKKLTGFRHRFAIVSEMLRMGPWSRLPLTIRWLNQDFAIEFPAGLQPPMHMPVAYGPVKSKSIKDSKKSSLIESQTAEESLCCTLCSQPITDGKVLRCLNSNCCLSCHELCLAESFLEQEGTEGMLLPIQGDCILCAKSLLWGDLIRQQLGCYQSDRTKQDEDGMDDSSMEDHWSQALAQT